MMENPTISSASNQTSKEEENLLSSPGSTKANTRRIIKAKSPPPVEVPSTSTEPLHQSKSKEQEQDQQQKDDKEKNPSMVGSTPALHSPSLAREQQQELAEKWRQERFEASAVKQREHREKELQQRRHQAPTSQTNTTESSIQTTTAKTTTLQVPEAFIVQPKYPEHKRAGEAEQEEGQPLEKRRKASMDDKEGKPKSVQNEGSLFVRTGVTVAVAVVAVVVALVVRHRLGKN